MKVAILCPFDIDRLTGTPKRAATTIAAAARVADVFSISTAGKPEVRSVQTGNRGLLAYTKAALAELRRFRPDIVHGITSAAVVPILLYCMTHRVKIIFELHGWAWYEQKGVSLWKRFALSTFDHVGLWIADVVVAVSHSGKKFLARRTRTPIRVLWDPVDFISEYVPREGGGAVVGYLGGAAWYQGIEHIIDAARILADDPTISFRIAGVGTEKFPKLPNITYVSVSREETIPFLQSCDIHISSRVPSDIVEVQFAHKLLEYMAAGRSVIVSSVSDQRMVVEKARCGYVADPLSGASIAEAIHAFALLSADERKAQALRAIEFARANFYVDGYVHKIRDMYEDVLSGGKMAS